MTIRKLLQIIILFCFSYAISAQASITIKMYKTTAKGKGAYLGTIVAENTRRGLLLVPRLHDLPPGYHGFHLHKNPSCANFAAAAGPHWNPTDKTHRGPFNVHSHRGDLPVLYVDKRGLAHVAVVVPYLKADDLKGHALVIHEGGDNYKDTPPNGGGGARIACGVVP